MATVFSKILEHVLLSRLQKHLKTTDNQFGFKRGHSTLMPILILKELLKFYRDHGSTTFVCFLDASKEFDRVDYTILFRKLVNREISTYILRLLWNWYSFHFARIHWSGIVSEPLLSLTVLDRVVFYHPSYLQYILMNFRCAYSQKTLVVDLVG